MEDVDTERLQWRYRGRNISEVELWFIFLSSLQNVVGVTASRRRLPENIKESITIEELEVTELDTKSCHQLLTERGVTETNLQTQITSVGGGNPFILHTICDMNELGKLSLDDIESLRADTLEQVRIKTWRRLFNQAKDLSAIIDRAGLLPFFNRKIMDIITPSMKSADWDQFLQLSFTQDRGDGTWTLHALARELVLAELGNALPKLVSEVAALLEQTTAEKAHPIYRGLAISAKTLIDEPGAIIECCNFANKLHDETRYQDALSMIDIIPYQTEESHAIIKWLRGRTIGNLFRIAEAEQDFLEALLLFRKFTDKDPEKFLPYLIWTNNWLIMIFQMSSQFVQVEEIIQQNYQLIQRLSKMQPEPILGFHDLNNTLLSWHYYRYARFLMVKERFNEAEAALKKSYEIRQDGPKTDIAYTSDVTANLSNLIHLYLESGRNRDAENAFQELESVLSEYFSKRPFEEAKLMPFFIAGSKYTILLSTGEFEKGIEELKELIAFGHTLVEADKTNPRYLWDCALYYAVLGIMLKHTNRLTEANETLGEAFEFARIGYEIEPRTFIQIYGMLLNNLALLNCKQNHISEATSGFHESLRVFRQLADQTPELYMPFLAQAINNYAIHLRKIGNLKQAESAIREALIIKRKRAEKNPDYFLYQVASSLNNLGVILAEAKKLNKARDALFEAYQLRKNLFAKAPKLYSKDYATTLTNLGLIMKRLDRLQEAQQYYQEAISIWEHLAAKAPETYQRYLTLSLVNLAFLHSINKDSSDDLTSIMKTLQKLDVSSLPECEIWIETEEDTFRFLE
ncbi:MAG: tetratricopeptide repeat protein, partial [Candidatus Hermodarchaeia archaeon]|jgi:tetratricopeptide (TPR) repeat protein